MVQSGLWWIFLGAAPLVYWQLPGRWRMGALGLSSVGLLAVYALGDLIWMLGLAALVFAAFRDQGASGPGDAFQGRTGAGIGARIWARIWDFLRWLGRSPWPFVLVLGWFVWSKYLPAMARMFLGEGSFLDFALPLGISFFSFKLLHYVIEMRRGNFPPHGGDDFAAWLFLAPIFTAGPIERFEHFLKAREITAFRWDFIIEGSMRIAMGLVKKFYVGAGVLVLLRWLTGGDLGDLLEGLETVSPAVVWGALFLTLAYVYLDFSAYSDIAIGSSRLFGLRIMENFNMPFLATSLQKFWQRWHMTLANWCRTYIYMLMIGLTRNPYWAIVVTFFVMGLWHAASPHWMIWGIWHGLGLATIIAWQRFAGKRRIGVFKTRIGAVAGWAMTLSYVALGGAFTAFHEREPVLASVRIIARAFGINL